MEKTYTVSSTRRQWLVKTQDGEHRRLFARTDKGAACLDRYEAELNAAGYTEAPEPEHWLTAMCREIAATKEAAE